MNDKPIIHASFKSFRKESKSYVFRRYNENGRINPRGVSPRQV